MDKKNTPLTVSASNKQADKLAERVRAAVKKSGISKSQLQTVLGFPGTKLENRFVAILNELARPVSGIITPVCAEETGLIPKGWNVYVKGGFRYDNLEGGIDLANITFDYPLIRDNEEYIDGDALLERVAQDKAIIGSLGLASVILEAQEFGRDIIPTVLRGNINVFCARTILRDTLGDRRVAYLDWDGSRWVLGFYWIVNYFHPHQRVLRFCN